MRYKGTFTPYFGNPIVFRSQDFEYIMKRFQKEVDALIECDKKSYTMTEFTFVVERTK